MLKFTWPAAMKALNRITVTGVVREVQTGFVNDEPCLQFTLVSHLIDPCASGLAKSGLSPLMGSATKQQMLIRCQGDGLQELKQLVLDGAVIRATGQFKHNVQTEQGKRNPFPFVLVNPTAGSIVPLMLHNKAISREKLVNKRQS